MIWLSGHAHKELEQHPQAGVILTSMIGYRKERLSDFTHWAADTGCFNQPERYSDTTYLRWLSERRQWVDRCLFATAPDVLGDPIGTWRRSEPLLPEIRKRGFLAALVAQDGIENTTIDWSAFDVLFMGGSTKYKLSEPAYALVREAQERGKWTHMGRVNSWKRLRAAYLSGYKSSDGTLLAHGPDANIRKVITWLAALRQPTLNMTFRATRQTADADRG